MIPPGWNVTEPIHVALQAIRTVRSIKKAPTDAKDFRANLDSFQASVKGLQSLVQTLKPAIETSKSLEAPPTDVDILETDLERARHCIERCEQFSKRYNALLEEKEDGKFLNRTGQASRWVWDSSTVHGLEKQLEECIQAISLKLNIILVSQTSRPNQLLPVIQEDGGSLLGQGKHNLMGSPGEERKLQRRRSSLAPPPSGRHSRRNSLSNGLGIENIPTSSTFFPADDQSPSSMTDLDKRWPGRMTGGQRTMTFESDASTAVASPITTPSVSPKIPAKERSFSMPINVGDSEGWSKEAEMVDMTGVQILVYRMGADRKPVKIRQSLGRIERHSFSNSKDVQILYLPDGRPQFRYVMKFSTKNFPIPQIEHSGTGESCVKLEAKVVAERIQQRRDSIGSASTIQSQMTSNSSTSDLDHTRISKSELPQPRLYFSTEKLWARFQELVMGPGITLQAQFSVQEVYSNLQSECSYQRVRLWHKNQHQYLMYFSPVLGQHREFDMMFLTDAKVKSKLEIKLTVQSSRNNGGDSNAIGLTRPLDMKALQALKYLMIKFDRKEDRDAFVSKARYNGVNDSFVPLSVTFD